MIMVLYKIQYKTQNGVIQSLLQFNHIYIMHSLYKCLNNSWAHFLDPWQRWLESYRYPLWLGLTWSSSMSSVGGTLGTGRQASPRSMFISSKSNVMMGTLFETDKTNQGNQGRAGLCYVGLYQAQYVFVVVPIWQECPSFMSIGNITWLTFETQSTFCILKSV